METGSSPDSSGVVPGASGFEDQAENVQPGFRRGSTWILPLAVLIGFLIAWFRG